MVICKVQAPTWLTEGTWTHGGDDDVHMCCFQWWFSVLFNADMVMWSYDFHGILWKVRGLYHFHGTWGLFRGLQHFRYANNVVPLWITTSDGFYAKLIGFIKREDKWCRGYEIYDKNYDDKGQISKKRRSIIGFIISDRGAKCFRDCLVFRNCDGWCHGTMVWKC